MINRYFSPRYIFCYLIASFSTAHAASITWVAQNPNSDMNNPTNWSSSTIPGSSDEVIFNSSISGIDTNPIESSTPFSVSTFNFPSNASVFNFNFNNETLTFNGAGITGSNTNPLITVTNINNSSFPGDLISLIGGTGNSGSSILTSSNSGSLTGNQSNVSIGPINSHLHSNGAFTIDNNGRIAATNTGHDSTNGTGNNGVANTGSSQLRFDQSFTAGNNVTISVANNGIFSGTNTTQGDAIGIINGSQFISSGAFLVGNNFNCEVQNLGNDSSHGVGLSNIGQTNAAQMILQTTGTVGNNCTIAISNTGINSSQTTNFADFIAYLNDQQFFVGNPLQAGDNFTLAVSNTAVDTSIGYGESQVSVINSNSGVTGNQILLLQGCALGNYGSIRATNNGTYSGFNTNGGSNAAAMNLQQIAIGDSTAPGSYTFVAGDYFSLSIFNSGTDSSNGSGGNAIADVSTDQMTFFTPTTLGQHANITIANSGNFSGNASTTYVNVGSVGGSQLNCESSFSGGDSFTLSVSNSGTNTGSGIGDYFVGDLIDGQQVLFQNSLILGNNASITISNSGSNSSSTTSHNQAGSFMGYGKQLLAKNLFQIGDDFVLEITNSGSDDSTGSGGNFVGFMNNDTVDNSASQVHLTNGATLGDRASITLSNNGTYQGSNTASGNLIGVLAGQQLYSVSDFHAGDDFTLAVSNSGTDNASAQNNNSMGTVGSSQIQCDGICAIGNNASLVLSNSGINNDTTGTSNNIGVINGSQLAANGNFTAGQNLTLRASNISTNEGNSNNIVGRLSNAQLNFAQGCTLNDGSVISAFNSGTVGSSQILFGQGFNIASGNVTIQAANQGTLGSFGIDIQGSSAGGDARIILSNSSLNVGTTLSTFTIGGLAGDSTSITQSQPQLIINTDSSTQYEFSGIIQDYPATTSTLMKTGGGTQILSGINTYTGLTSILEGILSINGSVAGDITVSSGGTLKGTGTIEGATIIEDGGALFPGNSIGTITLGTLVLNSGSKTVIEIAPTASSSIDVTGSALVDGVLQVVQDPGVFPRRGNYLILSANPLSGVFSSIENLPGFTFDLTYLGNNIYLNYALAIPTQGLSGNSLIIANHLNADAPSSDGFMSLATLSGDALNRALESVSPSRNAFGTYIAAQTAFSLSHLLTTHLDELRFSRKKSPRDQFLSALTADNSNRIATPVKGKSPNNKFSAWVSGLGEFSHQSAAAQNPSFHFISEAALIGLDYHAGNRGVAGGSLGYAHTHYDDANHAGHGNINYYFASAYGNGFAGNFYLSPAVWGLFNQTDNTRNISYPGFSEKAHADIFAWQLVPHLEIGYDVQFSWGDILPFTSGDWAISWQRGYQEHGASPFNAKQKANNSSIVRSETGLKFCEKWEKSWGSFSLREKVSYIFEKPFGTGTVNTTFVGIPGAFTVIAVNQNLNLGSIGLNLLFSIGKEEPVKLDFGYEGEFGSNYWSNDIMLTISKGF